VLRICLVSFGLSLFGMAFVPAPFPERLWAVPTFTLGWGFWVSATVLWAVPRMRRLSLPLFVVGAGFAYFAMVALSFGTSVALFVWAASGAPPWSAGTLGLGREVLLGPQLLPWELGSFGLALVITFLVQISRMLGPGVMSKWLTGRYRTPREEERWFMFVDMRDSTTLAEQLGDVRFSRLVQEFLGDMSGPVLATRGEVSHYIGDEAVLTWPAGRPGAGRRCLDCCFLLGDALEAKRERYLAEYGLVPGFKAGAHCGSVVATQVGEIKSEIVFHGDVLNTAARVQGLCSELGVGLLVTQEAWERVEDRRGLQARDCGAHRLKGKAEPLVVYAVERTAEPGRPH